MPEETQPTPTGQPEIKVPCEVYSRIVGYLRPVQNWNEGKQQEFQDRQVFETPVTLEEPEDATA